MDVTRSMADKWWLVLVRGLALLLLGLVFVIWPEKSIITITVFVGLMMLIDGIIASILGLFSSKFDGHHLAVIFQGLISIVLGLLILNWPKVTLGLIVFVIALWALVLGIVTIATAISVRKERQGNWLIAGLGLIALIISLYLFSNPQETVVFMSVIYGLITFISGILTTALSLDLRKLNKSAKLK